MKILFFEHVKRKKRVKTTKNRFFGWVWVITLITK